MPPDPASQRPKSLADIYISFTLLALQGFGGVLAIVQRELVERRRWLTAEEFVEDWGVAQILPGPNVVNLSLILGHRHFGLPGALAALAGMLSIPLLLVLILAVVYAQFAQNPQVVGALRGMSAVTAGMIIAVALKLVPSLQGHPLGKNVALVFSALSFIGIALLRLPLLYVLLILGGIACTLTYRRMK